jgi:hypothetical protein
VERKGGLKMIVHWWREKQKTRQESVEGASLLKKNET